MMVLDQSLLVVKPKTAGWNIKNTLRYTQLVDVKDNEYIVKVAKTVGETCALIKLGYEYVTEFKEEEVKIFRKRK